jgi:LDH2 family malate/lactate/ureidoglycolate dehydrogenase
MSTQDPAGYEVPVNFYPEPVLRGFVSDFLLALGAPEEEARIVTEGLMTAALWWHPGKGQALEKLFRYHRRVGNGGIVPGAAMSWVRESAACALLDAAKGFGYVAADRAMKRAIAMAGEQGIGVVGVRNSNHFAIAGYHALKAAEAGLIGGALTNAGAEMAPTGSAKAVLGTNPWGVAVPRRNAPPIVLDMALTVSGKGMMRWHQRAGKPIPETWALTPEGARTTDPAAAMEGALLPIGDCKGYGLSLVTDVLTGVMTGALFGLSVFQDDTHFDVGHLLLALDPEAFIPGDAFHSRLEKLVAEVKSAPPLDPARQVLLPGERELRSAEERRRSGVPVDRETVARLGDLSAALGIAFPL